MKRKTKLMLQVEDKLGEPIEHALPKLVGEIGVVETAQHIGVSNSTVGYWMLKLGIHVKRVAVQPGESIVVKRTA